MHEHVTDGKHGKCFKSEKARENKYGVPEVTGRGISAGKQVPSCGSDWRGKKRGKTRTECRKCLAGENAEASLN